MRENTLDSEVKTQQQQKSNEQKQKNKQEKPTFQA